MSDHRIRVVTIMNYPPDPRTDRMLDLFLRSVIAHGAASISILTEDQPPKLAPDLRSRIDLSVVRCRSVDVGHPHFNLRFKLPNLAAQTEPFLFLDADTIVLDDLHAVWSRRNDRPWIGINHQWVPSDRRTHRAPFLNSGVQLVGDPAFYDLQAILAVQNRVAPLHRASEFTKDEMFACPGADQAVLYRYFQNVGYDYTHPAIGPEWNSCAGVTRVQFDGARWVAHTQGLDVDYPVRLIHYWSQFKPWAIGCPIYTCGWEFPTERRV